MLHTRFRENRPACSREEDFLRIFFIYGRGGHFCHVISIITNIHFLVPESVHIKFGSEWHSNF